MSCILCAALRVSADKHEASEPLGSDPIGTKRTLTVDEAAAYLGVGRSKFYELVRTKQVPSVRIGRRILIPTRELESFLRRTTL